MQEKTGLFIVFEGLDGSGKSTQAEILYEKLIQLGKPVVKLREPTEGKWGKKIRECAREAGSLSPGEELELFIKDRKEDIRKNIKPALLNNKIVILDRYFYSTLAYQGARGIPLEEIRKKHESFLIKPDVVFIIDVPVSLGLKRIKDRAVIYRLFEEEDYLKKVRKIFLSLPDPECQIIDGRRAIPDIAREIWQYLEGNFPEQIRV
ncbi:MAG: dTMP kinase [Candidatus Aminicenantes bacterium]|nr:dTMP kinase [Candidatus Aminicenantes bacterium]